MRAGGGVCKGAKGQVDGRSPTCQCIGQKRKQQPGPPPPCRASTWSNHPGSYPLCHLSTGYLAMVSVGSSAQVPCDMAGITVSVRARRHPHPYPNGAQHSLQRHKYPESAVALSLMPTSPPAQWCTHCVMLRTRYTAENTSLALLSCAKWTSVSSSCFAATRTTTFIVITTTTAQVVGFSHDAAVRTVFRQNKGTGDLAVLVDLSKMDNYTEAHVGFVSNKLTLADHRRDRLRFFQQQCIIKLVQLPQSSVQVCQMRLRHWSDIRSSHSRSHPIGV